MGDLFGITPAKRSQEKKNAWVYNVTFRKYAQIAIDNFEWLNMPEPLVSKRFEIPLFNNGAAVFFYDPAIGYCVLPAALQGNLDVYWEPTRWTVIGGAGLTKPLTAENSVLIRNNLFSIPTINDVEYYAGKIMDIERTISTQVQLQKMPYLVKCSDKSILSYKNILERKNEGDVAIFVNNRVSGDDFEVFNTPVPYVIDKLFAYRQEVEAEFMGMLGYNNNAEQKAERMLVDEINANDEYTEHGYAGMMLQMRQDACEQINKMFGLNLDCRIKRQKTKSEDFYVSEEPDVLGDNDGAPDTNTKKEDETDG